MLKRICQSRKLAALKTDGARLLYTWLIPNLDINGCFSADPEIIKGQIFTRLKIGTAKIESYLQDLSQNGLAYIYNSNGDMYLCVPDFVEKQPHLNPEREAIPHMPPPTPEELQTYSRPFQDENTIKVNVKVKVKDKVKDKVFVPPTLDDVKKYIQENPGLSAIDPIDFFKGYNDGGWIDTQGKPVRNWKLKLITRSKFANERTGTRQPNNRQPFIR